MRAHRVFVSAVGLVLALGACSSSPPDTPSGETATYDPSVPGTDWPAESASSKEQSWQELRESMAEMHHITDPPEVSLVRYVKLSDWGKTQVECLAAAGFSVRESQGGWTLDGDIPPEQGDALNLASYICALQYPADPRTQETLPRIRAEMQYRYLVDTVLPCVTGLGYQVDDPPSLEVWLDRYYAEELNWDPFVAVPDQDLDKVYLECPHEAPDLYP